MNAHLLEEIVYSFVIQICTANISFDVMCYVADEILDLPTGLKIVSWWFATKSWQGGRIV